MFFSHIQTVQFRNLVDSTIFCEKQKVVLIGANGQGKTNFLEALYVLCYGSSFRTLFLKELGMHGDHDFSLKGWFKEEEGAEERSIQVIFKNNKRSILLDGKTITDRKDLIYTIPCIVFSHDDISFVNGEPEQRRRFFDQTMSMYDPLFFDDLRRYRQVLKQRNQAIKDKQYALLPIYDIQLSEYGLHIQEARTKVVYEFNQFFPELYRKVSGEEWNLTITYTPSWKDCATTDEIKTLLANTRERDSILQTTSSGVHRDRFVVVCDGIPFQSRGSTGQIRLASLLFRIAQMEFFSKKTGRKPVILVDDVLLELDHEKREKFLDFIEGYDQAFFTFLPEEKYFRTLSGSDCIVYDVKDGRFVQREGV